MGASKCMMYGCTKLNGLSDEVKPHVEHFGATPNAATITAREVMEQLTAKEGPLVVPSIGAEVRGEPPKDPNAFSDGALKNNKGLFWGVGGAGVWWPKRKAEDLSTGELAIAEYEEVEAKRDIFDPAKTEEGGTMLW